jgi:hypothetical protein
MGSPIVQQNQANFGFINPAGTGSLSYNSSQTAGNTNVIYVWAVGSGSLTIGTVTLLDSKGNNYGTGGAALDFSLDAGNGAGLWLFVATGIAAGSNTVQITASVGTYYDIWIAEYPASAGVRTHNNNSQFGGTAVTVRGTLSGTVSGDTVVMIGWDGNHGITTSAGAIGANAANQLYQNTGDHWDVQDGASDGTSSMVCHFAGTATDFYDWLGVALKPAAAAATGSVVFDSMNS